MFSLQSEIWPCSYSRRVLTVHTSRNTAKYSCLLSKENTISIARIAPSKFKLQDLICIRLWLYACRREAVTVQIEPPLGEDAMLRIGKRNWEVQVKGDKDTLSLESLAEHLMHFPERQADNPLIERLLKTNTTHIVFQISSRASDAIEPYCASLAQMVSPCFSNKTKQRDASSLLAALKHRANALSSDTELKAARKNYVTKLVKSIKARELNAAIKRLYVEERLTEELVIDDLVSRLQTLCNTPADRATIALHNFKETIDKHRISGSNIHADMMHVLDTAKTRSVKPKNAIEPPLAKRCYETLTKKRVLLLTGNPRVGKTYLARLTAVNCETMGYAIVPCNNLELAEREIGSRLIGGTLILLEDPLRYALTQKERVNIYGRLEQLINNLAANDLLIVTEATPDLLEGQRQNTIKSIVTQGHKWIQVHNDDVGFKEKIWQQATSQLTIPCLLNDLVLDHLHKSGDIEIGALTYLAANFDQLPGTYDIEAVLRLARQDAVGIAATITNSFEKQIMFSLAVATLAGQSLHFDHLVNCLRHPYLDTKEPLTSYWDRKGPVTNDIDLTLDSTLKHVPEFLTAIDRLEQRTLITISSRNDIEFGHPIYRNVGEKLYDGTSIAGRLFLDTILRRTIFGSSSIISQAALSNLHWMLAQFNADGSDVAQLRNLAQLGMSSAFPGTRDLCFDFLIRYSKLTKENVNLSEFANDLSNMNINSLEWMDKEPIIRPFRSYSLRDAAKELFSSPDAAIVKERKAEFKLGRVLSHPSKSAVDLLEGIQGEPEWLTPPIMRKLLRFNEAVIRAEAVRAWLSIERKNDESILKIIAGDRSPIVARECLNGSLQGWSEFSADRRLTIIELNKEMCTETGSALLLLNRWLTFDRYVDDEEKAQLWRFFSGAFPTVFAKVRAFEFVDAARLHEILRTAPRHLTEDELIPLFRSQVSNIETFVANGRLPDGFYFGIVDLVCTNVTRDRDFRQEVFRRLFNLKSTTIRMRVAAELTDNYLHLDNDEQQLLVDWLTDQCTDNHWVYAAIVTRRDPPLQLIRNVMDINVADTADHSQILASLPSEIIDKAEIVHLGQNSDFGDISQSAIEVFEERIRTIAKNVDHPIFFASWNSLRSKGDNGQILAEIINDIPPEHDDKIFDTLLTIFRKDTGWLMQNAWDALFARCEGGEKKAEWEEKIISTIPEKLTQVHQLFREFPEDVALSICDKLKPELDSIIVLKNLATRFKEDTKPDMEQQDLELVFKDFYRVKPVFLQGYDYISDVLRNFKADNTSTFKEDHKEYRNEFFKLRRDNKHKASRFPDPEDDPNWIPMRDLLNN